MNFDVLTEISAHAHDNLRRLNMLGDTIEGPPPTTECDQAMKPQALVELVSLIKSVLNEQAGAISRLERNLYPSGSQANMAVGASTLRG